MCATVSYSILCAELVNETVSVSQKWIILCEIANLIQVRAAAVTALAKFGAQFASLRPSILVLLKRCLLDTDNEVRDRATYYLNILETDDTLVIQNYIVNPLQVNIA